jgi:hypothetical protein
LAALLIPLGDIEFELLQIALNFIESLLIKPISKLINQLLLKGLKFVEMIDM